MLVRVDGLVKSFGRKEVLKGLSFQVRAGELVSLVGPSGVGKTTLLTIMAGLERADAGQVVFEPRPSKDRPVILVFQDYVLFPNLSVFDNVAFGLKARRRPRPEIGERVERLLGYFHLLEHRDHFPAQLSAGQRQRTALARAMVVNPSLLLLDEPFANLDRNLKMETARFIRATQREFGLSTVSVTHDLEEAFAMSDRMGLLLDGRLAQYDRVDRIYHRPASLEAAAFLGPVNLIPPELLPLLGAGGGPTGETAFARPESLALEPDPDGPAVVSEVTFGGHYIAYRVRLKETELTVYGLANGLQAGDRVRVRLLNPLTP